MFKFIPSLNNIRDPFWQICQQQVPCDAMDLKTFDYYTAQAQNEGLQQNILLLPIKLP